MASERRLLVLKAKVADMAERYEDMRVCMKQVVEIDPVLSSEERHLFSVAYKNVVGERRGSWRAMYRLSKKELAEKRLNLINEYKDKIGKDVQDVCNEVLDLIDNHVMKRELSEESKIFFLKMKGDYLRYLAEVSRGEQMAANKAQAETAYKAAMELARSHLAPTHPVRLGLGLNFSMFFFETCKNPSEARKVAMEAFDAAIAEIDTISQETFDDSTLIMQMLRDNIALWKESARKQENAELTKL